MQMNETNQLNLKDFNEAPVIKKLSISKTTKDLQAISD